MLYTTQSYEKWPEGCLSMKKITYMPLILSGNLIFTLCKINVCLKHYKRLRKRLMFEWWLAAWLGTGRNGNLSLNYLFLIIIVVRYFLFNHHFFNVFFNSFFRCFRYFFRLLNFCQMLQHNTVYYIGQLCKICHKYHYFYIKHTLFVMFLFKKLYLFYFIRQEIKLLQW